ncbi:hypothetical protein TNCV_1689521 [Trichonephila clavipes]|nr:hypothetical protein TNCV_1689521 [Trichonephila clavipes]
MKKKEITLSNSSHNPQHRSTISENNLNQDVYVDSFDTSETPSCTDQFARNVTIQNHQSETFKRHLNKNQFDSIDHIIDQKPEFKTGSETQKRWTRHIHIKSTPSPKCYYRKRSQTSPDNISVDYTSKKKCCLGSQTRYVNQGVSSGDYTPQKQYESQTNISDDNEDVICISDTPGLEYSPINSDEDEDHYIDNTFRKEYNPINSDEEEKFYVHETPSHEYSPINSDEYGEFYVDDTLYKQPGSDNHTYEYSKHESRYHTWKLTKIQETLYYTEEHNRQGSEWLTSDQDKSHESRCHEWADNKWNISGLPSYNYENCHLFGFSSSNDNKQLRSRSRTSDHDESAPGRRPRSSCTDQFARNVTIQNHQSETFKRHLNKNQFDSIDHIIDQKPEFKTGSETQKRWTRHIHIKSTPSPKCYYRKRSQTSPDNISVDYTSKKKCCLGSQTRYVNQGVSSGDYTPQKQYESQTNISDDNEDVICISDTPGLEYSPINSDEDEDHYIDNTFRKEYNPINSDEEEKFYVHETPSHEYSPINSDEYGEFYVDDTLYKQPGSDNHTYEYSKHESRYHTWKLTKIQETLYYTEEHNRQGSEWLTSDQDKSHESRCHEWADNKWNISGLPSYNYEN